MREVRNLRASAALLSKPVEGRVALAAAVWGVVLVVLGFVLAAGGVWLMLLDGSWYYLLGGAGVMLTGALLIAQQTAALWVYALVVLGTLGWAIAEVGFDWWRLAPRGGLVVLLGLVLLTPWVTRGLAQGHGAERPAAWRGAGIPLAVSLVLALGAGAYSLTTPPHLELGGNLPTATTAPADGPVPDGDWHAYGRTGWGQRYSPLDQITPANVDRLQVAWTYHTGDVRGARAIPRDHLSR